MTQDQLVLQIAEVAIELSKLRAENEILVKENKFLKELLLNVTKPS